MKTFQGSSHLGVLREDRLVQHVVSLLTQSSLKQRIMRGLGARGLQFW